MDALIDDPNLVQGSHKACCECDLGACTMRELLDVRTVPVRRSLARGDRLSGDADDGCLKFWIVVRGVAASCTSFADGRRQILALERPGNVACGLMSVKDAPSWLEALADCEVCLLDMTPNARHLREDSSFLHKTFRIAHERLARAQSQMATLGRLDSRERVTLFLAEMASHSDGGAVTLPMSREDIADYLGLNAETVSRILSQLRKAGLVVFLSHTEYVLPDMTAIQRRLPVPIPQAAERNPV